MIRWGLAVYCTAIACLIALLCPGTWRWGAVVPFLAIIGFWRLLEPHTGTHAGGPGFPSPDAGPAAGSMILDEEVAWRRRYRVPPLDEGGWASGTCADDPHEERWPAHDDPYWPQEPGTGGDVSPQTPPPPVPAEGPGPSLAHSGDDGPGLEDWTAADLRALHDAPTSLDKPSEANGYWNPDCRGYPCCCHGGFSGEHECCVHGSAGRACDAPGSSERRASTMEQEILSPLILECLDYSRAMADDCAAFMQHAEVAWAAMGNRGAPS